MRSHSAGFIYDVFIGHCHEDLEPARRLAGRLRADGVRVWFEEWVSHPGEDFEFEIEDGLENSRSLILLASPDMFGTGWPRFERMTVPFRDPSNDKRRFIPLLMREGGDVHETIRRYRQIDWRTESDESYQILLEACLSVSAPAAAPDAASVATFKTKIVGHTDAVLSVSATKDGRMAVSGSNDSTIRLQNIRSGAWHSTIRGHSNAVNAVIPLSDGERLLSASDDGSLRLWDLESEACLMSFRGHKLSVLAAALTPGENYALSASYEVLKLWDLSTGKCVRTYEGHKDFVLAVAVSPDGKYALSGSADHTLKLWRLDSGKCTATLRGHADSVTSVSISPDGLLALSGSFDTTLRLWDLRARKCVATFEGHQGSVEGVAISPNGWLGASASTDGTVKIWDIRNGARLQTLNAEPTAGPSAGEQFFCVAFSRSGLELLAGAHSGAVVVYQLKDINPSTLVAPEVRYTNAKVVLLGESGVGKSGLGYRLAEDRWVVTESTHGMRVWPLKLASAAQRPDIEREIWLWDLAGQPEYRLVHQLFLDETSLVLMLFNPQAPDPFTGIGDWEKSLLMAIGHDPVKLLVAARTDVGGATVTREKIDQFCRKRGYSKYFATSAKTEDDAGCIALKQEIAHSIPWDSLPWTSTTRLFKTLKDAILNLRDENLVLARFSELRQNLQLVVPDHPFKEEELREVLGLLAGQGVIKRLDFGDFILLQPEQLNNYASAVIRTAREHVDGIGCIGEREVLEGQFDFKGMARLHKPDEEILLRAMAQSFIEQSLCIREETPLGVQLAFPSQFNREIEIPTHPDVFVTYRFAGHLTMIYTTLVVRLTYSDAFEKKGLWKNAAEFHTPEGKTVGLIMRQAGEGVGEIKVFFDKGVPDDTRVTFIKYIHEHLLKRAHEVPREREYTCPACERSVNNTEAIRLRLQAGKRYIYCIFCDARIPLIDLIERKFNQDRFLKRVQKLDAEAKINLDNESRELILVGQAQSIAGEAGQIYRGYTNSDHGIDGEIEFKDDLGRASGQKIYLQLKSGDSYLYKRAGTEQEIFTVKKERHLTYWWDQAYPVYLVIRSSDGVIRWMNITECLKQRTNPKESKQIVFDGEPFNAQSLLAVRDQYVLSI